MRKGAIVQLVLIGVVAGAVAAIVAVAIPWMPTQASEERVGIDFTIWFTTWICVGIFAVVAAVTIYAVWKFRVAPDDDSDGPPIHGHTGLEIAWTAVPAVLVVAIGLVSAVVLGRNEQASAANGGPLRVEVTGQQFVWAFKYPDAGGITSGALRLPVGRSAVLNLTAVDVIHSFWVPEFGQKMDAVPGQRTRLVITPTKVGTYPVICTELCGLGHSVMRSEAQVMEAAEFDAWLERQQQAVEGEIETENPGLAVFVENGCGACHQLSGVDSSAESGPNLDELPEQAERAGQPLEEFIRESIVDPSAYVEPDYPDIMPKTYENLSEQELDALVAFLADPPEPEETE